MLRTETHPRSTSNLSKMLSTDIAYTLWGVFLLFLTTQIIIPLEPVPITLQTVGVMLIGLTFTRKIAIQSVMLYLVSGLVGLPVFTHFSGGFYKLTGPTGGYLVGFLIAALCMTTLRKYLGNNNGFYIALNCLVGTFIIFCCGIGWLTHLIGFKAAVKGGLMPFIIPGCIKIVALALALRYLKWGREPDHSCTNVFQ
ncbi:MAG TPA: biotin transporter BioY [Gammaproteobacteria bacterium]|nr:biotin transporter BioY [Gammaproteobacteria bacterium]